MTPKTQSVCKHCGQKLVRRPSGPSAPPLGTISSGYARYCDEVLQLPPETIPAPQTSAEPPELSDRAKVALYPEMRDELNRLRSENSSLRAYRLNAEFDAQLSAPQPVSGDAPRKDPAVAIADILWHESKAMVKNCSLWENCFDRANAMLEMPVSYERGDAPKVEELALKLCQEVYGPYMATVDAKHRQKAIDGIAAILRPYFPPASQTPPVDAFPEWWLKEWDDALASAQEYERDAANANPESGYAPQQTMTDEEIQVAQEATSTANVRRMIAEIRRLRVATPASTAREQKDKNDN